jgi:hypothetical protein
MYAIIILEKEKQLLEDCLKGWKQEHYPEAFNDRNNKLKDINKAIQILKTNNNENITQHF